MSGHRTVPVELGSYLSDQSSQALMRIGEFIDKYILRAEADEGRSEEEPALGYIAQHRIFHQIPLLRRDIVIPDYCTLLLPEDESDCDSSAGESGSSADIPMKKRQRTESCHESPADDVLVQGWLGPAGTVSPLHHDPHHNLLTQVCGQCNVHMFFVAIIYTPHVVCEYC